VAGGEGRRAHTCLNESVASIALTLPLTGDKAGGTGGNAGEGGGGGGGGGECPRSVVAHELWTAIIALHPTLPVCAPRRRWQGEVVADGTREEGARGGGKGEEEEEEEEAPWSVTSASRLCGRTCGVCECVWELVADGIRITVGTDGPGRGGGGGEGEGEGEGGGGGEEGGEGRGEEVAGEGGRCAVRLHWSGRRRGDVLASGIINLVKEMDGR
jgi:hypothetical protein